MLKFVVVCPRSPYNVALGGFTSKSWSGHQRNVLKSVMHVRSCCFGHKTILFFEVVVVVVVVVA